MVNSKDRKKNVSICGSNGEEKFGFRDRTLVAKGFNRGNFSTNSKGGMIRSKDIEVDILDRISKAQ